MPTRTMVTLCISEFGAFLLRAASLLRNYLAKQRSKRGFFSNILDSLCAAIPFL